MSRDLAELTLSLPVGETSVGVVVGVVGETSVGVVRETSMGLVGETSRVFCGYETALEDIRRCQ